MPSTIALLPCPFCHQIPNLVTHAVTKQWIRYCRTCEEDPALDLMATAPHFRGERLANLRWNAHVRICRLWFQRITPLILSFRELREMTHAYSFLKYRVRILECPSQSTLKGTTLEFWRNTYARPAQWKVKVLGTRVRDVYRGLKDEKTVLRFLHVSRIEQASVLWENVIQPQLRTHGARGVGEFVFSLFTSKDVLEALVLLERVGLIERRWGKWALTSKGSKPQVDPFDFPLVESKPTCSTCRHFEATKAGFGVCVKASSRIPGDHPGCDARQERT